MVIIASTDIVVLFLFNCQECLRFFFIFFIAFPNIFISSCVKLSMRAQLHS